MTTTITVQEAITLHPELPVRDKFTNATYRFDGSTLTLGGDVHEHSYEEFLHTRVDDIDDWAIWIYDEDIA